MIGITSGSVANWESGYRRPDVDMLKRLCIVLNVSADELLGIEQKTKLPSEEEMQFLACRRGLSRHDRVLLDALIDKMHADSYEEFRRTYKTRFCKDWERYLVTYGVCFAVLLLALLFVILYKRKPRRR